MEDDAIDVELTTTSRVGFHKYTFNKSGKINFILAMMSALLHSERENTGNNIIYIFHWDYHLLECPKIRKKNMKFMHGYKIL